MTRPEENGCSKPAELSWQQAMKAWENADIKQASLCMQAAIAADPSVAKYHAHWGVLLKSQGRLDERIACYRRAIELDPLEPSYPANLSAALAEAGDAFGAEAVAHAALRLDPERPESHFNLGVALNAQQRWSEAAESFGRAAELKQASPGEPNPAHPGIAFWQTAAQAWLRAGDLLQALRCAQSALLAHGASPMPTRAKLLGELGALLASLGHFAPAEQAVRQAVAIEPTGIGHLNQLGHVLMQQAHHDEAQGCFEKILALDPGNAAAYGNLGALFHVRGDIEAAIRYFKKTLAADPSLNVIWANLGNALSYALNHTPAEVRATFQDWDRQIAQPLLDSHAHPHDRNPRRRLKIGYVSPDFRKHSVAYFALPLIEGHDKDRVEVFCYYNHRQDDEWTTRFKMATDAWRDVVNLDDAALAEQIRNDGIDILVDLAGHTEGNRLLAFARRPAPIQVTWMGYVTTTGLSAMDWRITHADADPAGAETHYSERLYRLPGTMWCYRPLPDMPAAAPTPMLRKGQITFGSFNRYAKNSTAVLGAWAKIMARVPHSRLLICVPEGAIRQQMAAFFNARGVDPVRIDCFAKVSHTDFWKLHGDVDIALDPFPFGGGTTTCETLWLGVPVVTCTGQEGGDFAPRFASRMGYAFLNNIGHPELATTTVAEYIDTAVHLANDTPRLTALRKTLREKMTKAPLTDEIRFVGAMETAYRQMWCDWCDFESANTQFRRGNALRAEGRHDEAITSYRQALEHKPRMAVIHNNLGNALKDDGRLDEAVAAYRDALRFDPGYAAGANNLGSALRTLKRDEDALACFHQAVALAPDFAVAQRNLAATLLYLQDYPAAETAYRRAIELEPHDAELHQLLNHACQKQGKHATALASLQQARALQPASAEIHNGLGALYTDLGQLAIALETLQHARDLEPDSPEILSNLGLVLKELHRHHDAVACYQQALQIDPRRAEVHNNLALCWHEMGQLVDAEARFRRALALSPDFVIAHANLGCLLNDLGRFDEAVACFERALAVDPDHVDARDSRLFAASLRETDAQATLAVARDYGAWAAARARPCDTWLSTADPERPLRIGWVSGDLCIHPVGYFLDSVLTTLVRDHPQFMHVAYSSHRKRDELAARLQSCCSAWHEVTGWNDAQLAQRIHADGIDILIDLSGHTAHNRLPVFAWKPAPVQATWLGYFATTGVAEIDWLIADPHTLPASEECHFTEKIWRLPETRLCFTPPDFDIPVGPLPALTNGIVTFGCFNNLAKMNDAVVALWSRILTAAPASRLFLKTKQLADASVREHTLSRFAAHGISAARITLEGPTPRADYLAAYRRVDIALDPFPYPGGTTTVEALWMGVPVLTLAGERFLSRQGVGLLMNAQLPEWVANDLDDYLARAIAHAQNLPRLAALRTQLRSQLLASPLCDGLRFAGHFALTLRGMWQAWCNRTARRL